MSELNQDEILDFFEVVKKFEKIMTEKFSATMFNWTCLMNYSYKTKPYTPHVHWHCRPRYEKPVIFEGEEFPDPNFTSHYDRALNRKISKELKAKIINSILN